jgi:uncharacterized protein (TIGR03435 family)
MKRAILSVLLVVFSAYAAFGQSPPKMGAFEVASIKPNRSGNNAIGNLSICPDSDRGRVRVNNASLDLIIERAYGLKEYQLLGQPGWLTSERFDIAAKPQSPVGYKECQLMLQTLLAERFKLAIHSETRQLSVYKLVVAKNGPRVHKVDVDPHIGVKTFSTSVAQLVTTGSSMSQLAGMLASTPELDNLVVDRTGLDGYYEFTLEWTPESRSADGTPGPSLFLALQEQLGLKVEAGKGPVQVFVIDRIEKVPSEN